MVDGFLANLGVGIVSLFLSSHLVTGFPVLSRTGFRLQLTAFTLFSVSIWPSNSSSSRSDIMRSVSSGFRERLLAELHVGYGRIRSVSFLHETSIQQARQRPRHQSEHRRANRSRRNRQKTKRNAHVRVAYREQSCTQETAGPRTGAKSDKRAHAGQPSSCAHRGQHSFDRYHRIFNVCPGFLPFVFW